MAAILSLLLLLLGALSTFGLDLTHATVVYPPHFTGPEKRAVTMLIEEVEKRTHVRWAEATTWPAGAAGTAVVVGRRSRSADFAGPYHTKMEGDATTKPAEGYEIQTASSPDTGVVFVIGNDARGVLFGVGRLLRELRMHPGSAVLADNFQVTPTAPKYPLRGHQLGYRPKTNSYDAWDLPQWEQYFRDLIIFGCNAIELIPPRSDDDADSPHFPRPPMEMMVGMSRLAAEYGLDVWIWYPAMDRDYSDAKTVDFALKEWGEVFRQLPRVDAVFVPGGDPGHTRPKYLMALLEKQTRNLHQYHPRAQMWVSPQSFNQEWLEEFLAILKNEQPNGLSGVVFGPQIRGSLPELRAAVPSRYPIRHYPDITHSRQCQYPVPDWDVAYALTEARECINPRPEGEAAIFRLLQPDTIGFLTYSEGCNDDVNKAVWSALGWDPDQPVVDILRSYSRYFIGDRYTDSFAQGLLALERDWQGPLIANEGVGTTLAQFQALERTAAPRTLKNWRFQQALFRAYYDAYTRTRLLYETELEEKAMQALRQAPHQGSTAALVAADQALDLARNHPAPEWRLRIFELAEALFQSIGMQLSVPKYQAIAVDRGASLDTVDYPVNNRQWLREQFARIRKLGEEADRLNAIDQIVQWTNPGPGGFYDDFGDLARHPHLVRGLPFAQDPGSLVSPRLGFEEDLVVDEPDERPQGARRLAWMRHAESLFDAPLQAHYTGLDPQAQYKIRIVYAGDSPRRKIRLEAGNHLEIHPFLLRPFPFKPIEFAIPPAATQDGELTLKWYREPGLGGNGRGCQVSEVWLMKQ